MSIDDILQINSREKLLSMLDTDSLRLSDLVRMNSHVVDLNISSNEFVTAVHGGLGLSLAGVYLNGGINVNAEIGKSGDVVYDRLTEIDAVNGNPKMMQYAGCQRLVAPLGYRGKSFGTAVFGKKCFTQAEVATLIHLVWAFSQHINNVVDIPGLQVRADTDALTGLFNRGRFDRDYETYKANFDRGHAFSVIFGDIDRFKQVNDTYGHAYGDYVIQKVAELIRANIRDIDLAYRYGGEEIVVILPGARSEEAENIARRINDVVRAYTFGGEEDLKKFFGDEAKNIFGALDGCYYRDRNGHAVRMSMGVASTDEDKADILRAADMRLLTIKECCRDAVLSNVKNDVYTGIAGLSSFLEHLENRLLQCNRSNSGVAVLLYDVVHFREVIDTYGTDKAWDMFFKIAKWIYDSERHNFDYVARVCDRDHMVVALSSDGSVDAFENSVKATAELYLRKLHDYAFEHDGKNVHFEFAVGGGIYHPSFCTDSPLKKPALLFGLAENNAEYACERSPKMLIERYGI
jgi:diguanylate cyclase (GGDEF)-like protein